MSKPIDRVRLSRKSAVFLALLPSVALLAACSSSSANAPKADPEAPSVAVAKAEVKDLSSELVLASEFLPYQEVEVHAKVAGYVQKMYVDVGDRVKAGQMLAILEIPELQDEVRQADASVHRSEEEIRKAQSDIDRSDSAHEVAHLEHTRLAAVAQSRPGLVAAQEIDDASAKDREAEAQIATDKAALAAAQQELEVAKANEARLKTMLAYSNITAPFTGVITKRYADTGSMIQAGTASNTQAQPVVRLAQNDVLRLVIPVPESAVPDIHLGNPVEVSVPVLNRKFTGRIARFADQLDVSTRTMRTEVDVPNPKLELVPGLYAEASVSLRETHNALAVPVQAIARGEDRSTVFAIGNDNRLEERTVQLGIETPSEVQILSGLNAGDLVVVEDRTRLRPGDTVVPKITAAATGNGGA
jgi:RND family efflux transporter MFP subunit